ncbi:MAG: sulfatase [Deltaproteobacteria bacterium]|nr:sulfatase [Deltaproteobacteria bacterium]
MSLLFIVVDSLRADVLGCCGGPARTSAVDHLAGSAALFPRTVSAAPWTVPSVAAMLTGVYPHRLGLAKWEQPWPAEHPSLFDLASRAGFEVTSFVFEPRYFFRAVPAARVAGSSQNTERVLGWLRERRDRPFCAFVHYWWTHIPYVARATTVPEWRKLTDVVLDAIRANGAARDGVKALYRHAVERFSEDWLPRVLEAVDLDRTWVVLVADHGESWGERCGPSEMRDVFDLHGNNLFEESLRVPLLIRPPGGCPPRRIAGLARTVDLLPTLADLLGLDRPPPGIDGMSLGDSVRDGRDAPAADAFSARNRDFLQRPDLPVDALELWCEFALTTPRHKLVWNREEISRRAYDLVSDPMETNDVAGALGATIDGAWKRLEAEAERAVVGPVGGDDLARTAERLRALGYLE